MYLSRIRLRRTAGSAGTLARLLEQVTDPYSAHRLVWSLFAGDEDGAAKRSFLFRSLAGSTGLARDGFVTVSAEAPEDRHALWEIETKPYAPRLGSGERLGFSLRANPTRHRAHPDDRRRSKRDDVVMHAKKALKDAGAEIPPEAELAATAGFAWLADRSERCGFTVDAEECRVGGYAQQRFRSAAGHEVSFSTLDFDGVLTVADPALLTAALFGGIGPARAFGCGLMLVRRI